MKPPAALLCAALSVASCAATFAPSLAFAYTPITPSMSDRTVTLTGHDLSIDDIVRVARLGARVELSPEARTREADGYGLLIEASTEGIPVYWFNRGVGQQRETVLFDGDPLSEKNRPLIEKIQAQRFREGAATGVGPEIDAEEIVRAMMVVRANAMVFNAPSPQLAQMLLDLLNKRVTPVVQSRGSLGEADLAQLSNVGQTMIGVGDAYFAGERMPAAEALRRAGLAPLHPFGADDNALTSSNAYATGQAALLVHDAEAALQWADITYAMDLNGMNSSITPLSRVVQQDRPEPWLNWHAARMRDMIRGSYLFDADRNRIIQDPESLRASSIRQGSAWEQWGALRDAVTFQANSSDHNPAVSVGSSPQDSWELSTPQMMRYYVRGGARSRGQHGYIVSNANWDPYPMANQVESFVIALGNMDIAVTLRIERLKKSLLYRGHRRLGDPIGRRESVRLQPGGSAAGDPEPHGTAGALRQRHRRYGRGPAVTDPRQAAARAAGGIGDHGPAGLRSAGRQSLDGRAREAGSEAILRPGGDRCMAGVPPGQRGLSRIGRIGDAVPAQAPRHGVLCGRPAAVALTRDHPAQVPAASLRACG